MQATTHGERTPAGQGKTGVTKAIETLKPCASPAPASERSCSTEVTKASPQRRCSTCPVNTTTEANVPTSHSDQHPSDCFSADFVWPTPRRSLARPERKRRAGQVQRRVGGRLQRFA